jgi:hypothetical protein
MKAGFHSRTKKRPRIFVHLSFKVNIFQVKKHAFSDRVLVFEIDPVWTDELWAPNPLDQGVANLKDKNIQGLVSVRMQGGRGTW